MLFGICVKVRAGEEICRYGETYLDEFKVSNPFEAGVEERYPLDFETILGSVSKTRRAVIVHEAITPFGVGAEIAARLSKALFGRLAAPVERVGAPYCPVPFSKPLETAYVPSQARIEAAIRATLG